MKVPARVPRPRVSRRSLIATISAFVVLLILLGAAATFYTDLLWFREIGFEKVFTAQLWTKFMLGLVFGAIFAVILLVNLWVVQKVTSPYRLFTMQDQVLERYRATLQPYVRWGVVGISLLFGLFAGSGATSQWKTWLLFSNAETFGQVDPIFRQDLGFYIFRLPFHRFLFTWAFSSLVVITIVVGVAHYFMGGIRTAPAGERVTPQVRAHMSVLLGLLVLLKAWGYRLDQFGLLYSTRGQVSGATYTDDTAQLPALKLLVIIAIVAGVLFLINIRLRGWILPAAAVGILGLTSIVYGGLYPTLVQRFRVTPNELLREEKYIARNIEFTRKGFGIDTANVTVREFPAADKLDSRAIQRNAPTVQNIRLWDPGVLERSYTQLQRIRSYYQFADVDVDRYEFGGTQRQVMLSTREIAQSGLRPEARTWLNSHLVYTHGFGVVASRVDRVTGEGQPSFIYKDIPGTPSEGFPSLTEPRIYFGESQDTPFVVVHTKQKELDYPQGDTIQSTAYTGTGGTQLSGILRRAAFAWRFRDFNLLISGAITGDSRIIFRRTVGERLRQVAPFLKLDGDPYVAVVDGRLVWIQDGYTTTDMYPYSERIDLADVTGGGTHISGTVNYIRNSVKATVDAMNGTITLYVTDETDPIIRAWRKVFPSIFRPATQVSPQLRAHFRYPEDLFSVQSDMYTTYHIERPADFYAKEDAWRIPGDPTTPEPDVFPPYYVIMRLPGEQTAQFIIMQPFAPFSTDATRPRQNMTAWLAARSDPEGYGQLISFVMPRQKLVFGPEQVFSRIQQDPSVSSQISLWDRSGSKVIHGNLLVIPIEDSLLYVHPLYLEATTGALPELKRVVVVAGETVRMGETLDQAIKAVFGQAPPAPIDGGGATPPPAGSNLAALIQEAINHFAAADRALRAGDLATYQREVELAKTAIEQANRQSGATASPSPRAT